MSGATRLERRGIAVGCALGLMVGVLVADEPAVESVASISTVASEAAEVGRVSIAPTRVEDPSSNAVLLPRGADEVEVCGGGWVELPQTSDVTPESIERERAQFVRATRLPERLAELLAGLRQVPDSLAAATARVVELSLASDAGDAAAAEEAREALVRTALSTTDAKLYALAFKVCGAGLRQPPEGSCRMIHARRWAQLDPDNAAPWLFMLGDGQDRAALEEAMHRIATSTRSDLYFQTATGALIEAAPSGEGSLLVVYEAMTRMIGVEAAVGIPQYQTLSSACRGEALKDSNRAQVCDGVATLWSERSATMMERMMGVAIGKRLEWPRDRTDRLRGEYEAYSDSLADRYPSRVEEITSCGYLRRGLDDILQNARLGEAGAMRVWVAASNKTPQDFIREQRERERSREAAAAARQLADAASAARATAAAAGPASAGPSR